MGCSRLAGKKALVTGASRGIGREIALAFAREGADVACNYNQREDEALSLVAEIEGMGRSAYAIKGDVSKPDDVAAMVASATASLGQIDILVNNAGFASLYRVEEMPLEAWNAILATHLTGTFMVTQQVLPQMLERHDGRIINIASQLAYRARAGWSHYSAAKAGIIAFTRVLAQEVSRDGVLVNCIAPGPIDTDIVPKDAGVDAEASARIMDAIPLGRSGTVQEVAPSAVFLASSDATYYVGQVLGPNGGDVML
ncbi:MAG TPA: 3-oxoacyl-ACP reductase family protein [Thermomicrobiales bacterium]|nr:3-oxoacyl-ACP reductase family protein [Thermomicrobiales bacterium]